MKTHLALRFSILLALPFMVLSMAQASDDHSGHDHAKDAAHAASGGGHGSGGGGHPAPKIEKTVLKPATRYNGRTPIDMTHGLLFNNGTYGLPDTEYESIALEVVLPGVSAKPYPFEAKKRFVTGLEESAQFVQHAMWNWERTGPTTKEEAKTYSQKSIATLKPLLEALQDATKKASKANSSDWEGSRNQAMKALIDLRATYWSMHNNVRR